MEDLSNLSTKQTIDARNLLCPMPVIKAQSGVESLAAGDKVEVICTDPGAKNDIPAWCRINGHKVILIDEANDEIRILIEVGSEEE